MGMPWGWAQTKFGPVMLHEAFLYASLALLVVALWFHFREPFVGAGPTERPHTDAPEPGAPHSPLGRVWRSVTGALLAWTWRRPSSRSSCSRPFSPASTRAAHSRCRSPIWLRSPVSSARWPTKVWVETDPNRDMLTPVDATLENPLGGSPARPGADANYGFSPDGVPDELYSVTSSGSLGCARRQRPAAPDVLRSNPGGTGGESSTPSASTAAMPRCRSGSTRPPPRCWAAT